MRYNITIDTDPGIDDALALLFSYRNKLPVRAVTTVYGNSTIDNVTKNAGYIVKSIGTGWEIYKGASRPISGQVKLAESHGQAGLGNVKPAEAQMKRPNLRTANDYLESLDAQENNVLFCIGPLSNLALALKNNPALSQNIHRLVIMGGAFAEKGNATEFAEFNIYNDPEAARLVLDAAYKEQINTTVIPVEICRKILLTKSDLEILQSANLLPDLKSIVEPYVNYYISDSVHGGYQGAVLYDVLIPLYYLYPQLFTTVLAKVSVVTDDTSQRGRTTFTHDNASSVKLCININAFKAKELVMDSLAPLPTTSRN
ncbi:MAG: nucleoside hydrolase [Candidatus Saccharimonadales bacterium]